MVVLLSKTEQLFEGWLEKYGSDKIILGADVKNEQIAISGWQETTSLNLFDFLADYTTKGVKYVICTDIAKDGLLQGASVDLYKKIRREFSNLQLIASGGVTSMADMEALIELDCYGAIIGKAIYEGKLSIEELVAL